MGCVKYLLVKSVDTARAYAKRTAKGACAEDKDGVEALVAVEAD